jgi:hypothetical protein
LLEMFYLRYIIGFLLTTFLGLNYEKTIARMDYCWSFYTVGHT